MTALRRYLVAGLLVWIPAGLTLVIVRFLVDTVDGALNILPMDLQPEAWLGFRLPGAGLVVTAVVVLVTGMVVSNLLGRKMVHLGERLLNRIPVVRSIYSALKQLTEGLFSGSGRAFSKAVLIEYPRTGCWTVGFLTGEAGHALKEKTGKELLNVFVPTTPNPTSGFFLMVGRDEVLDLGMSVDDGLKLLLSLGVVAPRMAPPAPPMNTNKADL